MADLFSTLGNALGGLFGIPQGQQADKANKQSQQQQALGNQYGAQAAGVFGGLQGQGQAQVNAGNQNYLTLLDRYGSLAGLGNPLSFGQQGHPADPGGRTPTVGTPGTNPAQGQSASDLNPYSLDGNQQAQLSHSLGQVANAQKTALADFQAKMAASGLANDPRAMQIGAEQLQEHFASLHADTEQKFYEQVKQDKLSALQQILSGISQYSSQGVQELENAGSGYLGLQGGAQSAANQNQNTALQQQANQQNQLSGLLNLAGFGLAGGFNKPASQSAPVSNTNNSGLNISGALASLY